jgi:hypothetical protein
MNVYYNILNILGDRMLKSINSSYFGWIVWTNARGEMAESVNI